MDLADDSLDRLLIAVLQFVIIAARWAQFLSAAVLFGAPTFLLYAAPKRDAAEWHWPKPLLIGASLLLALAALTGFSAQTISMAGSLHEALAPGALSYVLFSTDFGRAAGLRVLLAAIAAGVTAFMRSGRRAWRAGVGLGFLALGSLAWSGHGGAEDGVAGLVHVSADLIHLWAAGAWIGALAALCCMIRGAISGERRRTLHFGLERFSGVGTAAVLLLLASGLINSFFLVGPDHWAMLFSTLYGRLLLLKVLLFAGMIALAVANRFRFTPMLGRQVGSDQPADLRALRASVTVEALFGVAVIAIVAALGVLTPIAAQ